MVLGLVIAVTHTPRVTQWAEMTKMASGRLSDLPKLTQAAV
jgi:hypothetical protein